MSEATKRIKILTSGHIPSKGNIYGPVLTPYRETISSIFGFIAAGVEVVEVLSNGQEVPLTVANYKLNNEPVHVNSGEEHTNNGEVNTQETEKDETPIDPETTSTVDETETAENEEEPVIVQDTVDAVPAPEKHNKKKKNRH